VGVASAAAAAVTAAAAAADIMEAVPPRSCGVWLHGVWYTGGKSLLVYQVGLKPQKLVTARVVPVRLYGSVCCYLCMLCASNI